MKVTPVLNIELNVSCPECGHYFDMILDTNLNEDGWLLNKILPEKAWYEAHKNFECSVICPNCSVDFDTEGVDW